MKKTAEENLFLKKAEAFYNAYPDNVLYSDYSISVKDTWKLMAQFASQESVRAVEKIDNLMDVYIILKEEESNMFKKETNPEDKNYHLSRWSIYNDFIESCEEIKTILSTPTVEPIKNK
jgi:hypothetical protein